MGTGQTPRIELFQHWMLEQEVGVWPKRLKCAFSSPQGESSEDDNGAANESLGEADESPAGSCRNRHLRGQWMDSKGEV